MVFSRGSSISRMSDELAISVIVRKFERAVVISSESPMPSRSGPLWCRARNGITPTRIPRSLGLDGTLAAAAVSTVGAGASDVSAGAVALLLIRSASERVSSDGTADISASAAAHCS